MIGRTLSHFTVTAKLGEGGMGEVYRARDSKLGRDVALKVLPEGVAEDPVRLERFAREARSIAALNHPNIVTIHSVEEADGMHVLAMELVEGESLDRVLPAGGFDIARLLSLGMQIADALAAAHEKGITHRDLKPANVMVTPEGRIKVLDFGLAKLGESGSDDEATQLMTREGMILGTVPYMSPEQAQGQPVDPRSDVFSLGILLYEMSTGERPFRGDNAASVISAVLKDHPTSVSHLRMDLPRHLGRILRRCLEKRPERRYPSAREVQLELEGLERELALEGGSKAEGGEPPPGRADWSAARGARARFAWLVAGGALLAAAILGWAALRPAPEAPVVISRLLPPPGTSFRAIDGPPVLSPDGRRLAFLAAAPEEPSHLYLQSLDRLEARRVEESGGAQAPFWSPDGKSVAFFADGKLKRVEASGGGPRVVADAWLGRGGTWSESGKIVFVAALFGPPTAVDADGGSVTRLPRPYPGPGGDWYLSPFFLPDGRHFLFTLHDLGGTHSGINVGSLDPSDTPRTLTRRISNAVYVEPGYLLLWEEGNLVARPFDPETLELGKGSTTVVNGVGWGQYLTYGLFSVSRNGVLVYQPGTGAVGDTELVRVDREGRELEIVAERAEYYFPRLSHDGRRVAVDITDVQRTYGDIWILELEGERRTLVSNRELDESGPVWLPDDSEVVYMRVPDLFRRSAAASSQERPLLEDGVYKEPEDVSPDGRYLLFDRFRDENMDIWVLDLESGEQRPWVEGVERAQNGVFAPNGRWIAYELEVAGELKIAVRSFPEGDERIDISIGGGGHPRWRADGGELFYYATGTAELCAVPVSWEGGRPRFGSPRALFEVRLRDGFDVFPDGESFLLNRQTPQTEAEALVLVQNWPALLR